AVPASPPEPNQNLTGPAMSRGTILVVFAVWIGIIAWLRRRAAPLEVRARLKARKRVQMICGARREQPDVDQYE
ncbi:MAG TPA: hypothetical protein PKA88_37970, partial [Polyangiaceae bacterium]|nr:hypothetical protein [Polyangiaceae bacterium]